MPGNFGVRGEKRGIRRLVSVAGEVDLEDAPRELHRAVMNEEGCTKELFCCNVRMCSRPCGVTDELDTDGSWLI